MRIGVLDQDILNFKRVMELHDMWRWLPMELKMVVLEALKVPVRRCDVCGKLFAGDQFEARVVVPGEGGKLYFMCSEKCHFARFLAVLQGVERVRRL